MSDEPKPEEAVQDVEQETPAEAKPGKKAKVAKKKSAESQAEASATADTSEAPAPTAEGPASAEASAEPMTTLESVAVSSGSPPPAGASGPFEQGVQALLRADYDGADNFFGQALTNSRKNGDQAGQIAALEQLGHLCYLRGAIPQAQTYYQQASAMRGA